MLESKLQILMTHVIPQMEIAKDPAVHGSTLVPILLGSDKTIASVGTGNVEYYPLYMSIRNLHNDIRHAHRGGVAAIGILAIPTCESSVMSIGMYVNLLHFTGEKKDEKKDENANVNGVASMSMNGKSVAGKLVPKRKDTLSAREIFAEA